MIRFRTIDPETTANANVAAPAAAPRPTPTPALAEPASTDDIGKKAKGLTRKTPLRAKKQDAAPLFDEETPAPDRETAG